MKPTSLAELSRLPHSALGHLQAAEGALRLPHDRSVAVLRYDNVAAALSNPELTVRHRFRPTLRLFGPTIFDTDGCEHRRQRPPVVRGLADGKSELVDTGRIDEIAARALASLRGRPAVELTGDLAVRIVTEVMAHLTGLTTEESLHLYRLYRPVEKVMSGDASAFEEARANLVDALDVYARRNRLPAAGHSAPLTRALNDAVTKDTLTAPELDRHQVILFLAGVETTICAISNVLWMLVTDKRLLRRLRELSPEQLEGAVAELLRCQSPLFSTVRFAVSSLDICGVAVEAGTPVNLCLAAACWDRDRFSDPHTPILTRPGPTNLMFGRGSSHVCPGMVLAKQEIKATLRALTREVDDLHSLDGPPPPIEGHVFRRPSALDASIDWAA